MSELLPCPFCGSESVEADSNRAYRALVGGTIGKAAAIQCDACDAEMMRCYADMPGVPREDVMADLIETWNRRAPKYDGRVSADLDSMLDAAIANERGEG